MNPQQQALFFRQLAAVLKSGIPLAQGVGLSIHKLKRTQQQAWQKVCLSLARGQSLQTSMRPVAYQFFPWAIAVLSIAEECGSLEATCRELADRLDEIGDRRRLMKGMIIRFWILVWATGMVLYLILGGKAMTFGFWLMGVTIALGIVLLTFVALSWTPFQEGIRRMPPLKLLFDLQTLIHLGYLQLPLDCSLSILAAVEWLQSQFPDRQLQQKMQRITPKIRQGTSLTEAMQPHFPLLVMQLVQTGETAGTLPLSFDHIRQYYQREFNRQFMILRLQVLLLSMLICSLFVLLMGIQVLGEAMSRFQGLTN